MVQSHLAAPSLPKKIGSEFCLEMAGLEMGGHVGWGVRRISGGRGSVRSRRVQHRHRRALGVDLVDVAGVGSHIASATEPSNDGVAISGVSGTVAPAIQFTMRLPIRTCHLFPSMVAYDGHRVPKLATTSNRRRAPSAVPAIPNWTEPISSAPRRRNRLRPDPLARAGPPSGIKFYFSINYLQ
jgi:hypothetical protein